MVNVECLRKDSFKFLFIRFMILINCLLSKVVIVVDFFYSINSLLDVIELVDLYV